MVCICDIDFKHFSKISKFEHDSIVCVLKWTPNGEFIKNCSQGPDKLISWLFKFRWQNYSMLLEWGRDIIRKRNCQTCLDLCMPLWRRSRTWGVKSRLLQSQRFGFLTSRFSFHNVSSKRFRIPKLYLIQYYQQNS